MSAANDNAGRLLVQAHHSLAPRLPAPERARRRRLIPQADRRESSTGSGVVERLPCDVMGAINV